jgi:hypothetical protein
VDRAAFPADERTTPRTASTASTPTRTTSVVIIITYINTDRVMDSSLQFETSLLVVPAGVRSG